MHIEHLETVHFRNLHRLTLELSPRTVVVRGPNAQGKTNILEALYVAATGRSFRHATSRELLQHGSEGGRVRGVFSREGVRHDVEVRIRPRRRDVRIDGRGMRQTSKLLEVVNVVAFFPDDLRVIKGSPEERRRFLDRSVANHRSDFVEASISYQRALKQRNALLKSDDRIEPAMLEVYDRQLIEHGSVIHAARLATLERLGPLAAERFGQIMNPEAPLSTRLVSGVANRDGVASHADDFAGAFAAALRQSFARDRARGSTSAGPHRADLDVRIGDEPARQFASQGQQRAIVLSLKLAEVVYLTDHLGSAPVLLLDDVSSELDATRTTLLFDAIADLGSQVWLSTTGAADLPLPDDVQIFDIHAGVVEPAERGAPP